MNIKLLIALTVVAFCALIESSHGIRPPSILGKRVQLQSVYDPSRVMRHHRGIIRLHKKRYSLQFKLDSSFDVVPGLSGIGVSFRSVNYPDHFIRHSGYVARLHKYQNKRLYKEDASFIPRPGLANRRCLSFESVNFPGHYLRIFRDHARITRIYGHYGFYKAATWCPRTIKNVVVSGEWALLYSNDNAAASGRYTISIEEGVTVGTTSSITRSVENSWRFGLEAEVSGSIYGISLGLKTMFETSGTVGVSRTRSSSWSRSRKTRRGYTATLIKGQPFYFWQWCVHATTADSAYITSKTDIYKQTTANRPPPPIRTR